MNKILLFFAQWQVSGRTYFDPLARIVQRVCSLAFLSMGLAFYSRPKQLIESLGLTIASGDGLVEVKAFYGLLEVALGIYLWFAKCSQALSCSALLFLGSATGRTLNFKHHSSILHRLFASGEFLGVLVCLGALHREHQAMRKHDQIQASLYRRQHPDPQKLADFVPFCSENIQNPFPFYKALRQESPVYLVPGLDFYMVSRAEDIQAVCKDVETYSSNLVSILLSGGSSGSIALDVSGLGVAVVDVLALQDPPAHSIQRKFAQAGLNVKLFEQMEHSIRQKVRDLFQTHFLHGQGNDNKQQEQPVDWMEHFAFQLPMQVTLDLFGFPSDPVTAKRIKILADHGVALMSATNTPEEFAEHVQASSQLITFVEEQFALSTSRPASSEFINSLKQGIQSGELSEREAICMILQIIFAGNDSSAATLGSSMRVLCERPHLANVLRSDPKTKIPAFIDEVLRMESPFAGHYRKVTKDTVLNGVNLKRGDRIMLLWGSANRDEAMWGPQADEFQLERFLVDSDKNKKHFSFGYGIHLCLGNALAKREVRIMLEELLRTFSSWKQVGPKPYYIPSTFTRSLARYHVVLQQAS